MRSAKIIKLEQVRQVEDVANVTMRNNATIEDAYRNLRADLVWSMTMRKQSIVERPGYLNLVTEDGTDYYLFAENDGTLRVSTEAPTANSDGDVVGDKTD